MAGRFLPRRAMRAFMLAAACCLGLAACVGDSTGPERDGALAPGPPATAAANDTTDGLITTASGLRYSVLREGDGGFPLPGAWVTVHYEARLEDGTLFDSSRGRDEPLVFQLGRGRVIPGWDEGIALMRLGDTVRLTIPPGLAYGESGAGPIPPGATLVFEVELLDVTAP